MTTYSRGDGLPRPGVGDSNPHPTNSNILLEIKHVSVDYYAASGTVHALTDVSITLERGQILGLVGESGSGKSTLAYAITRLLRPPAVITEGQLLYYPRPRAEEDKGRLKGSSRATARVTSKSTTTEPVEA